MLLGGVASAEEPVVITPSNLKDDHKGNEVLVAGELVQVLPDRTHNAWLYVIRVAGTLPATLFHKEQPGAVDVYVTLADDGGERKLLAMWKEYQEALPKQTVAPPNLVKLLAKGENLRPSVPFNYPGFAGESGYKGSLNQARLLTRPE
jgi:hypothetical protein